ncbi:hypothetical protein FACS189434_11190 [Bacteroidia bacterium]|nr:hypothetical protein FACS189434_11190 [Bacteroidia bacterium]
MKIFIHTKHQYLKNFILNISEEFDTEGYTIHKVRNEVKVFSVGGIEVNVKKYAVPHLFNRIVYTFFRKSKAERAYRNALKVQAQGIDTPAPVAYVLCKRQGLLYDSYFVSLQQPYLNLTQTRNTADIYAALGKFIAELQQKNILHLDLSFGNILLNDAENNIAFSLVDLNRMKFRKISPSAGFLNFNRLHGNEAVLRILAKSYAETRNREEKECCEKILRANEKHFHSRLPFHSNRPKIPVMAVSST